MFVVLIFRMKRKYIKYPLVFLAAFAFWGLIALFIKWGEPLIWQDRLTISSLALFTAVMGPAIASEINDGQ